MITISEVAATRIKDLIVTNAEKKELDPNNLFLRVYIAGAGPQGIQHGMALTTDKREDDQIIETDGVQVLVDRMSEQYLVGSEIDFVKHELGSNFKIINPNQVTAAGCSSCSGDAGCC
ncbi:MAG: HesB/IscA family protein [Candidatus Hodarchaeales archaeon]|jgi:iron-sulfur cluster assembly accessory protein